MRKWSSLVLLAAALQLGCGGGGSSSSTAIEEQTQSFQMGLVRGDAPTTVMLSIAKPFYPEATVELAQAPTGAFQPAADTLPMTLASGHEAPLWVTFTPPAAPVAAQQEGTIRLLFRRVSGGDAVPVTLKLYAQLETPSARLAQAEVPAGNVVIGDAETFGVYVENTSVATPITVTSVTPPDGDFSIAPNAFPLPALVAPGSRFLVRFQYAPQSMGYASSAVRIYHSASVNPLEATLTGTGTENFVVQFRQEPVSAGNVVVGEKGQFGVYVENTAALTAITVTDVTLAGGEFTVDPDADPLPVQIDPHSALYIPLVYTPGGVWDSTSLIRIDHTGPGNPLEGTVTGTGIAAQIVNTYDVWLDEGNGWQDVYVPAEAVSIFLEAEGDPSSLIDLIWFEGPGGVVYEDGSMTGPLGWTSYYPAGGNGYLNVELPNSELPDFQLVPGGGWYKFGLHTSDTAASGLQVRVTITQRTVPTVDQGTLNVRVFLAAGLNIDPADAMSNATLAEVMKTIDAILGSSGIRLGNLSFTVMDLYDTVDETTLEDMFRSTAGLPEGALNLFFVTDMSYDGASVAGIAGATPGPWENGTPYSGVAIDFNQADAITVGVAAAHEIGHYLGHFDMGEEGWLLLEDEAYPVLRHPLLNPGLPQDFLSPPDAAFDALVLAAIQAMPAMDTACGTCMRPSARP